MTIQWKNGKIGQLLDIGINSNKTEGNYRN